MSPEEHSSQEGMVGVFSRAAATYDSIGPRFFTHLGQRLVELSHLTPGATVLDVAAGRGAVLFAAANQVGPSGPAAPSFDTPAKLATAFQHAGFEQLEIRVEDHEFVYATDAEWWLSLWSHGIRSRLEQLAPPDLEQVRGEMLRKVHVLKQPDGIHTLFRVLFARAYKPSPSSR